jgi:hypothetical protein
MKTIYLDQALSETASGIWLEIRHSIAASIAAEQV